MRVLCSLVFVSFVWDGANCFAWKPSTNLPLATNCRKSAHISNAHHRHYRELFAGSQQAKMVISPESAKINVVEGPFQGQFGLWFVDSHDAQVFSPVFVMHMFLCCHQHFYQEVLVYRLSLLAAATSLSMGTFLALMSLSTPNLIAEWSLDLCAFGFLASFGVSLTTIHIYVKPLHNMLKVELISVLIPIAGQFFSNQFCVKGALAWRRFWVTCRCHSCTNAPPCPINISTT
jgi:hypothetical protein